MEQMVQTDRKLAAIMFTDMVSFTEAVDQDEALALERLDTHNEILRTEFQKFKGNEIKSTGDGFLVQFYNSLDSVKAAISIQKAIDLHNTHKDNKEQIQLRIGLHLGDVEEKKGDIFGDGVNIAARIEPLTDTGGICISKQIYDQVNNKIKYDIQSRGQKKLKNISGTKELYQIVLPWQKTSQHAVGERKVENSIAVLAFDNMSPDKENEYFSDGISETILNLLAKEKDLKVISRTSSFTYKDKNVSLKQIGYELGVENILEGSVRKAGNKVRITAQLIRASDDFHLWSDTYDRTLNDIFAIQDEIASFILTELLNRLVKVKSEDDIGKTQNVDAYNLYLEGRHHWNQRTKEELEKAIECFEKCLEIDPGYSLAYCGIADSWLFLGTRKYVNKKVAQSKAWEAINIADGMGFESVELFTSRGGILASEFKNEESSAQFLKAIELNPNYATTHEWLSILYSRKDQINKAIEEIDKALALDPISPIIHLTGGNIYRDALAYDKAITLCKETSVMSPGFLAVEANIGVLLRYQNKWKESEKFLCNLLNTEHYNDSNKDNKISLMCILISHYLCLNDKTQANRIVTILDELPEESMNFRELQGKHTTLGFWYACLEDWDNSIKHCNHAVNIIENVIHLNYVDLATVLIFNNKYDKALEIIQRGENKYDNESGHVKECSELWFEFTKALISIFQDNLERAYVGINNIKQMKGMDVEIEWALSALYFMLNNLDEGFAWYRKYLETDNEPQYYIIYDLLFKNAHKDARFNDILKEMKLYDYWKDSL